MRRYIEKVILKIIEGILPATVFDRIVIWWRRKVNKVKGKYPEVVFYKKKKAKKKYCVVRYAMPTFGIMAAGIQYIFCYYKLLDRGYIPVLDLEYEYSYRKERIGEHGIWDLCFEQTIAAKDVVKEKYVLITGELYDYSADTKISEWLNGNKEDHFLHTKKDDFREYYAKANELTTSIWKVKESLVKELDEEIGDCLENHRVLGVFLRENFSSERCHTNQAESEVFARHPLLPTVSEIIELIKNNLKHWNFDMIYLSTIYADSVDIFKEEFGNMIVTIARERRSIRETPLVSFSNSEKELYESYCKNIESGTHQVKSYIKDIVALSRCTYFLGGPSSGSAAALTMNGGKYEDIYILEDRRKIMRY